MAERAGIFDDATDFDVSKFKPKPVVKAADQPTPEAVREVSEKANFQSREPSPPRATRAKTPEPAMPAPRLRRKRTGRSIQLNVKTDAGTLQSFYALADGNNWGLGETLEKAVAALARELDPAPKSS